MRGIPVHSLGINSGGVQPGNRVDNNERQWQNPTDDVKAPDNYVVSEKYLKARWWFRNSGYELFNQDNVLRLTTTRTNHRCSPSQNIQK